MATGFVVWVNAQYGYLPWSDSLVITPLDAAGADIATVTAESLRGETSDGSNAYPLTYVGECSGFRLEALSPGTVDPLAFYVTHISYDTQVASWVSHGVVDETFNGLAPTPWYMTFAADRYPGFLFDSGCRRTWSVAAIVGNSEINPLGDDYTVLSGIAVSQSLAASPYEPTQPLGPITVMFTVATPSPTPAPAVRRRPSLRQRQRPA
jgi:hypothetical protein